MDIQETISRARKEYKDYLRGKHPEWAESTLSTHVSDAFYLYQNTIALSFWKCLTSLRKIPTRCCSEPAHIGKASALRVRAYRM